MKLAQTLSLFVVMIFLAGLVSPSLASAIGSGASHCDDGHSSSEQSPEEPRTQDCHDKTRVSCCHVPALISHQLLVSFLIFDSALPVQAKAIVYKSPYTESPYQPPKFI